MAEASYSHRITIKFMTLVAVVLLLGGFAVWNVTIKANHALLKTAGEQNNVDIAQILIQPGIGKMAEIAANPSLLNPDSFRQTDIYRRLSDYLHAQTDSKGIMKIKVFDPQGVTVFSTSEAELGKVKQGNKGLTGALNGETISKLVLKNQFDEFEQEYVDHSIVETYLPLRNDTGDIVGVFEVYSDGTKVLASIDRFRGIIAVIFIVIGIFILSVLYFALGKMERKLLTIIQDRAQLKAETENLEEMNRVKTEFLALLSHELRTPLNAIVGFSDLMVQEILGPVEPEKYRGYVTEIHASGYELTGILNKVLFMSSLVTRSIDPVPVEFDMKDAVNAALAHHVKTAEKREITIEVTHPREPLELVCDESHVIDAISNLISNAIKFAPVGGSVGIGYGICNKTIDTGAMCHGDPCVVVTDNGPGIAADKRDTLIQVFSQEASSFTRTLGGLGLGLPIAQALANLNGGELVLGESDNGGARVALVFPLSTLAGALSETTAKAA